MSDEIHEGLDIAIVGMAGRFPGANNIKEFWELLKTGREAITYFSDEELLASGVDPALLTDPNYVKSRCIIADEDKFDAHFFDFFPREVEMMDPQHRLFLETCWHALEEAGYDSNQFDGLIGVFGGVSLNTYLYSFLMSQKGFISSAEGYQLSIGNDKDFLTTRVSYKMNLKGPSVNVQTACSTSLVAVHLACQNLLNYNCDMALAGGVSITIPQKQGYFYQEGMILSKDGHCRAFDEKASGTISGSGVGVVVLKRLSEALEDRDHIYAVIKGSAYNNDGSMRAGYTAPSVDGQSEVIANSQAVAGIEANTISYIETHGTGTTIGDPIEITALSQVFRESTDKKQFCGIGSVKTNIGHLDAAAGVAGLIKTALALKNKCIPPSINFEKPNPKIDFENSPFFVVDKLTPWASDGRPRRAGISSFGIGGTNVHAILEEAPVAEKPGGSKPARLFCFSAKSKDALDAITTAFTDYLGQNPDADPGSVAYTLHLGRKAFNHRRFIVAESSAGALDILKTKNPKRLFSAAHAKDPASPAVAFMFSGQGSQYVNMGKELYETEAVFREWVDRCSEILQAETGLDLRSVLYPNPGRENEAEALLNQTNLTQPALFIFEYAIAQQLMHWGVKPHAMAGHSIGEYTAACLAGVISLEDAVKVVAVRGRLMQKMPAGAMVSIPLDESRLQKYLNQERSLAAVNSSGMSVISGAFESIEQLETQLKADQVEFTRLHTSHAFHSSMMDPILEEFKKFMQKIDLHEPVLPYLSNLTGTWITKAQAVSPEYYADHIRKTVRYNDNLTELLKDNDTILLELGPGTTLSALARRHSGFTLGRTALPTVRHPHETISDYAFILNTIGRLWLTGVEIDWYNFYQEERLQRLSLPLYPFERKRYWLNTKSSHTIGGAKMSSDAIQKNSDISTWFYLPSWKQYNLPLRPKREDQKKLTWLIFKDTTGLSFNFIDHARASANKVIMIDSGSGFEEKSEDRYAIAMDKPDNYKKLFSVLDARGLFPDIIVHFWNITIFQPEEQPLEKEHIPGFKSILFLAQALEKYAMTRKIDLGIMTNQLFNITGFEHYKPGKAMVLGLAKVIPQEFPNIHTRVIDVLLPKGLDDQLSRLALNLTAEFVEERKDLTVAYRSKQRWVQDYEPVQLDMNQMTSGYMKEGGVYFITGGLGRIGLSLAEKFSAQLKAAFALIDYFDFPAQENWDKELATRPETDPIAIRIKRLKKLIANGTRLLVLKADVGVKSELQKVTEETISAFGRIDGVIHASGIVGTHAFKAIPELKEKDWADQFHAKVKGAKNIADVISPYKPDFILLQSSLSAVLGGLGFGAYAAANAFLDAIAFQENQKGFSHWISVNWEGWDFEQNALDEKSIGAETAQLAVKPDEGLNAFERILSYKGITQIIVSTGDLHERIDKWIKLKTLLGTNEQAKTELSGPLHARPSLPYEYIAPETDLHREIAQIWQKLLGIEGIGIYDDFFDLGGNSLMGTQLISKLRESFRVELPLRSLFDDPTISGVAKTIESEREKSGESGEDKVADLLQQLEGLSEEETARLLKEKKNKE